MRVRFFFAALVAGMLTMTGSSYAADEAPVLTLRNKQFVPTELTVPAGVKVKLVVRNEDSVAAEFESYDLSREVVVAAQGQVTIYIGPLKPGRYGFFNDFDRSMTGSIVAQPAAADKK
jgi:plastocyanin